MLRGIQKSKEKTRTEPTILSARNFPVKSVQSSGLPTKYCFRNIHIYPYIPCTPFCSHCSCKPSHRMLREAQAAELGKNKRNYTISENCIQYVNSNSCFPLFSSDEEWWHAVTLPISWLGTGNAELAELPLSVIQDRLQVCYQIRIYQILCLHRQNIWTSQILKPPLPGQVK